MKILSIDTSSKICSVAVLEDTDLIIEKHILDEKTHSQKLMPLIDDILKSLKLDLSDFDLYACSVGPGSFTGVRIGVSTIKAFCDVTFKPTIGINSLESLAYNALNTKYKKGINLICSIIDAKNDNVYYDLFQIENNELTSIVSPECKNINDVISILKMYKSSSILFVGDGAEKHQYLLSSAFSKSTFVEDSLNIQSATSQGIAAFNHYKNGEYGYSNDLTPMYLRKSQAERALDGEK